MKYDVGNSYSTLHRFASTQKDHTPSQKLMTSIMAGSMNAHSYHITI